MLKFARTWYQNKFSDPHAVTLAFILLGGFGLIYFYGQLLMPILVAIVLAYILDWPVTRLSELGVPRSIGASLVLMAFAIVMVMIVLGLLPAIWQQVVSLVTDMPSAIAQGQKLLLELPDMYPDYIERVQLERLVQSTTEAMLAYGRELLSLSLSSLLDLVALMVYLIVVPLLLFFFLKDKAELAQSFARFAPNNRQLANAVASEMNVQIGNYIRGKAIEIGIVGVATFIGFTILDVRYAALLSVLVGLSVLIPYIGATIVTIPVAIVGFFQFGISPEFGYVMMLYGVIQMLDGNVLVPLLFSEAVNLHPVMIIIAVLIFGGLWGFWGVFFAIPLATLVKAVLNVWPTTLETVEQE